MSNCTVKYSICKKLLENFGEFNDLSDIKSKYPEFDEIFNEIRDCNLIVGTYEKARFSETITLERAQQICVEWHPAIIIGTTPKYG